MLCTFIKATSKEKNDLKEMQHLLVVYTMAFGDIPNITETPHGILINDPSHCIVLTLKENVFTLDIQREPKDCTRLVNAMKRLLQLTGGGTLECSTETSILDPLKEREMIEPLPNLKKVIQENIDDLEKFLSLPFDDKGFLSTMEWNYDIERIFVSIVYSIDDWFYSPDTNVPLKKTIKYLVFKYNMENFCLYCLKLGARGIDDILEKIEDYYDEYKSYLSRYDSDTKKAMCKGLNNIKKLKPIDNETNKKIA